VNEL